MSMGAVSQKIKRPQGEANHSLLSSAEVNNAWGGTTFLIGLHGTCVRMRRKQEPVFSLRSGLIQPAEVKDFYDNALF